MKTYAECEREYGHGKCCPLDPAARLVSMAWMARWEREFAHRWETRPAPCDKRGRLMSGDRFYPRERIQLDITIVGTVR